MASSSDQSGVLKKLKEEVTCPLCLDTFKDPKRLPCEHIYCRECLHGLALRSLSGTISCPECRSSVQVPNRNVSIFSTPHQVNRLIEMYERNLEPASLQVATQPEATCKDHSSQPEATCKDHSSQPLALYCDTCQSLVCRDCVITSCSRNNHEYGFIDEMAKKHRRALDKELEPIRKLHQQMSSVLREVATAERELQQKKEEKMQKINATFDALFEILVQERIYCTEAIEKSCEEQSHLNREKEHELSEVVKKLESLMDSVERLSQSESTALLSNSATEKKSIHQIKETTKQIVPRPVTVPERDVDLLCSTELKDLCLNKNYIFDKDDPLKARYFDRDFLLKFQTLPIGKPFEGILNIDPTNAKRNITGKLKLDSTFHSGYSNFSQTVRVKQIAPEKYSLSFIPQKRGEHKLHIKYDNNHVCGSPIPVYVTIELEEITRVSKPVVKIIKGATAVKSYKGKIYFSELYNAVHTIDPSSKTITRTIGLSGVGEIFIHGNFIFASDITRHLLLKVDDANGEIVAAIGGRGVQPGEFSFPNGIGLSRDGNIYVCDSDNHRIQVFDYDLNFLNTIGRMGTENSCFNDPSDLEFDNSGNLYVADTGNQRIQVLSPQGEHIRSIGRQGSGPGELNNIVSIAIHKDMVYASDASNKRISVFKTTGEFVTTFGEATLTRPECITIDENGYVYVTEERSKLIIF